MDTYSDIRPYNDEEVAAVLQRLLDNRELLDAIGKLRAPRLQPLFPRLLRPLVRRALRRQLRGVETVRAFQVVVKHYMDSMIEATTDSFTVSGLENLNLQHPWLLISNHRDIALDPAFVNYALYQNGGDTVRIAIGDNLLGKPFAADLMRLNKSFIVKRSAKGPRQILAAYKNLSAYIRYSLTEEGATIWLAQREGRAKDGIDATEPAIIKMLCMSQRKGEESFGPFIQSLGIVPVAISYEWDPCDAAKARELSLRETEGAYLKTEFEDLQSIALGISGQKGRVHVHFGEPLTADFSAPADVAAAIDAQIVEQYRLQPSNIWAYEQRVGDQQWRRLPADVLTELGELDAASRATFDARMASIPADYRARAVAIYANPVIAKLKRLRAGGDGLTVLDTELKSEIQTAYSRFLEAKGLRPRYGQRLMIAHIARTLAGIRHDDAGHRKGGKPLAVVEAGTGTGKTLAYILAALPIARARGKTLVIATATVALQEQILLRDIPDIIEHAGLDFDYALAKGRQRYLCHARLDQQLSGGPAQNELLYPDERAARPAAEVLHLYQSMADALARAQWDGDRDQWSDAIDDELWRGLTTEPAQCTGRRCSFIRECAFFAAREKLLDVDVIVANHDLVLADLALGGGAILPPPEDSLYVFDEAHHLPDKVINHFSFQLRYQASERWLEPVLRSLRAMSEQLSSQAGLRAAIDNLAGRVSTLLDTMQAARPLLEEWVAEGLESSTSSDLLRFEHGMVPPALRRQAEVLMQACYAVLAEADDLQKTLEEALDKRRGDLDRDLLESWLATVATVLRRIESQAGLWRHYQMDASDEKPPMARWIRMVETAGGQLDMELCCSPILAANTLMDTLWKRCYAAVLTSATLTALGDFQRLSMRAGLADISDCAVVPSPFHYQQNAELVVPAMDCDAGDARAHTDALIDMMPALLARERGNLALFSSWRQMQAVYEGLDHALRETILIQGDSSKHEMLRRHRQIIDEGGCSTLFGLASFAEGVDLPGDYCRHVIIAKIPFAPPDDPVEQALAEWIEKNNGNAFMDISVPDAALKLVQASGRLLRKETDSGRITLLDRRVLTRRYGQKMLDSLPPYRRVFE